MVVWMQCVQFVGLRILIIVTFSINVSLRLE